VHPLDLPNPSQPQNSTRYSIWSYKAAEEEEAEEEVEAAEAEEEEVVEEHHQLNKPSNP